MATARKIVKTTGNQPSWDEPSLTDPEFLVENHEMSTQHEQKHGLWLAPGFYAMAENAYRHHLGVPIDKHQQEMGRLFSRFTEVAEKALTLGIPKKNGRRDSKSFGIQSIRCVAVHKVYERDESNKSGGSHYYNVRNSSHAAWYRQG